MTLFDVGDIIISKSRSTFRVEAISGKFYVLIDLSNGVISSFFIPEIEERFSLLQQKKVSFKDFENFYDKNI